MRKDRMEYLLCKLVDMIDMLNNYNSFKYESNYEILSKEMSDEEMEELGLDIEYLKGN